MTVDKIDMLATSARYAGNTTAASAFAAWVANKTGLSVQDWVAILAGVSAVASYMTSTICTIVKTRREMKNPD